jgi:hypothetical protein
MLLLVGFWTFSPRLFEVSSLILACVVLAAIGLRSLKTASTHENLSREQAFQGPSDRSFGFVMAAFFLLTGLAPLRHHLPVRLWALGLAVAFLAFAFLQPRILAPLNKAWMLLGRLLSRVMTPIVTGLLFYLVFTPAGFIYRLLRKDSLHLRYDKAARSYWIERHPPGPPPDEMLNQF